MKMIKDKQILVAADFAGFPPERSRGRAFKKERLDRN